MFRRALLCVVLLAGGCSQAPETAAIPVVTKVGLGVSAEEQQVYRSGMDDTLALQSERERLHRGLEELGAASPDEAGRASWRLNRIDVEFRERDQKDASAARKWLLEQVRGKPAKHFAAAPVATSS